MYTSQLQGEERLLRHQAVMRGIVRIRKEMQSEPVALFASVWLHSLAATGGSEFRLSLLPLFPHSLFFFSFHFSPIYWTRWRGIWQCVPCKTLHNAYWEEAETECSEKNAWFPRIKKKKRKSHKHCLVQMGTGRGHGLRIRRCVDVLVYSWFLLTFT